MDLIETLRAGLPGDAVLTDPAALGLHTRDSAPFGPAGAPAVVARPRTVEQVQHVVRTAHALRVPVVPQGARTGLAGGANAVDGCVVLSLTGMDRILEIDQANRLVRCEPGVTTRVLADAVAEQGLFYPPDPVSRDTCTIGGNIATGAGGLCCVKYGVTADYVLGLGVVLADGTFTRTGRRTVKGVAGLDLTRLFVGSEGTLGVIVEATLALRPARRPALAMLAQFGSAFAAGAAVAAIIAAGHTPSALELMDRTTTGAIIELGHPLLSAGAAPTLIVESEDGDLEAIAELCALAGAVHLETARSQQVLEARRMIGAATLAVLARMKGRPTAFVEDVAVPRGSLAALVDEIELIAKSHGLYIAATGHAGDGNLHPLVLFDQDDPDEVRRAEEAHDAIMAAALELGGTITGEHGVGLLKRAWLRRELDPVAFRLQQEIKALFDPAGILNPGKVLHV
ncbi:FAD-linked oxidase C-terminal domain-containing protein [Nonomuraea sp. NPDC046570]|uniref:FAD-binding oxidoreductase n=1 Tax=Nonomuraea sp. NPDC046570 TaxID=3155255 RepID=UPI0033F117C9